jgi:hypothetical protein
MTSSSRSTISWLMLMLLALLGLLNGASAKKLGKVKAGITYKHKDPVHIIVNTVG